MKTRIFISALLSIFVISSLVLAAVSLNVTPTTLTFTGANQQKDLTITNPNNATSTTVSFSNPLPITSGSSSIDFTIPSSFALPSNESNTVQITLDGNPSNLEFGTYTRTLIITSTEQGSNIVTTSNITLEVIGGTFCSSGEQGGNLSITDVEIDNRGDGEDDEWEIFDDIEVTVEFENDGSDDMEDVVVELGLFDSSGNNIADDLEFTNEGDEEIDYGDLDEGDDDDVTFEFRVPADFAGEDDDFQLVVKVYSDDSGQSVDCTDSNADNIKIAEPDDDEDFIAVDDIEMDGQATCGESVSGRFTVFNIGDKDLDDVAVRVFNSELSLNQNFELEDDLEEGKDEDLSFSFTIPDNAANKQYDIEFRGSSDEGTSGKISKARLSVLGCTGQVVPGTPGNNDGNVILSASLGSDAEAGEQLTVNVLVTNTGAESKIITVEPKSYDSWAELVSVSTPVLNLESGESRSLTMKFNVKEDASGAQSFIIETNSNGMIDVQEVEVNLEDDSRAGFSFGGNNGLIWAIAIVNIILIVLIILVAIRLSRK